MSDTDRFASLSRGLDDVGRRMDELIAERDALKERLRGVVGELRTIQDRMHNGQERMARSALSALLRRLEKQLIKTEQ